MSFLRYYGKGIIFLIFGILIAIFLAHDSTFQSLLLHLGTVGYIGAFIAGLLFISTITVAIAVIILISLSQYLSPIEISIIAGLGATAGNYLIFLFMNKKITHHVHAYLKKRKKKNHIHHHVHSLHHLFLPFLGVVILASPLPDEIGIFLLSLFKMKTYQFLLLSFTLKSTGIFLLLEGLRYFG